MPNTQPSWDDVLEHTPLNIAKLIEMARGIIAGLPLLTDADKAAAEAKVRERLAVSLSLENLTAAFSRLPAALISFASTGKGPVQKSPTDLI